jgi:phosphoglycolate phosphatase-like HAD superfamily hydrolase
MWNTTKVATKQHRRALVLWDIDHTLIETRGVGAELYKAAFEEVTRVEMKHRADVTGATEPEIFAETMRLNGLDIGADDQVKYALALARRYDQSRQLLRRRGRVLPGAREALSTLHRVPGVIQSVLTGNLTQVAIVKVEAFDLREFFDLDVAAYGENAEKRPQLVAVAQTSAAAKFGQPFDRTNTIIIGDSESDVTTGRMGGAYVIGVASGKMTAEELRDVGANYSLDDLSDARGLRNAILAHLVD